MVFRARMAAIAVGGVLAGLIAGGCSSGTSDTTEAVRPAAVKVARVERGDIALAIEASGTIAPLHEAFIGPRVSGRIEELFADVGDYVEKGSPLVRLEQVRFKFARDEAQAALRESQAQLENLQRRLDRTRELFEQGIADRQQHDDMLTEVELARARKEMAAAQFDLCREDYEDSVLHAPFAGFVVGRRMNSGEMFSASAGEYVFHLVDTSTVKVEVHVFETRQEYVQVGKKVPVAVDAVAGGVFEGDITVANPLVDPGSRKFLVKIEIPNPGHALQTGMFARVRIPAETRRDALLVPTSAITERDGRTIVFVADGQTARRQEVRVGLQNHALAEITDGLNEGDPVIVDGLYAVKDGTPLVIEGA